MLPSDLLDQAQNQWLYKEQNWKLCLTTACQLGIDANYCGLDATHGTMDWIKQSCKVLCKVEEQEDRRRTGTRTSKSGPNSKHINYCRQLMTKRGNEGLSCLHWIVDIQWPETSSNVNLYERKQRQMIEPQLKKMKWRRICQSLKKHFEASHTAVCGQNLQRQSKRTSKSDMEDGDKGKDGHIWCLLLGQGDVLCLRKEPVLS